MISSVVPSSELLAIATRVCQTGSLLCVARGLVRVLGRILPLRLNHRTNKTNLTSIKMVLIKKPSKTKKQLHDKLLQSQVER